MNGKAWIGRVGVVALAFGAFPAGAQYIPQGPTGTSEDWVTAGAYRFFHVVVPEDAPEALHEAAAAFREHWRMITHQAIDSSPHNQGRTNVWLDARMLTPDVFDPGRLEGLGEDGYVIHTYTPTGRHQAIGAQKQLIIAGATSVGARNGVYAFFERHFDVRWLAPGVTRARMAGFAMRRIDERYRPPFEWRAAAWPAGDDEETRAYRTARRLRGDGPFGPMAARSAYELAPPGQFFETHPEWYASRDGARTAYLGDWRAALESGAAPPGAAQLCATNPDLASAIAARILDADADLPAARWSRDMNLVSVSPMPWGRPCRCAECGALAEAEESAGAPHLLLANRVAEALRAAADAPPRVHLLLDGPFMTAPKTLAPGADVIVQLDASAANPGQSFYEQPGEFTGAVAAWAARGATLWARLHAGPGPFPDWPAIQANLRYLDQHGVAGVAIDFGAAPGASALDPLRGYLHAALLWDPDAPIDGLISEFLTGYYVASAPQVEAYLEFLRARWEAAGRPHPRDGLAAWLDAEARAEARGMLAAAAESAPETARPRVARLADDLPGK